MKHLLPLFLLSFFFLSANSQNLVPNPSFEDTVFCPISLDQVPAAEGWSSFGNSPDYFNSCSTNSLNVPNASFGFQNAQSGSAFVGFIPYIKDDADYREFIGREMTETLSIGNEYHVSFYANCANLETYRYAVNNIGVLFSTVAYTSTNSVPFQNHAHVFSSSVIADTLGWTLVSGSFIADSAYRYVVLGNFFDNEHTDTLDLGQFNQRAYYYIDNLCVREIDGDCLLNTSTETDSHSENTMLIFPNPTVDIVNLQVDYDLIQEVSLFDFSGRPIINHTEVSQNRMQIDLGELDNGTYVLKIKTEQKQLTKILTKTN